jgi:hypothetical protein
MPFLALPAELGNHIEPIGATLGGELLPGCCGPRRVARGASAIDTVFGPVSNGHHGVHGLDGFSSIHIGQFRQGLMALGTGC